MENYAAYMDYTDHQVGRLIDLDVGLEALVTVHPSYLLRLPDEEAKAREYRRFVADLKIVAEYSRQSEQAA